jgi:hypothetical protein
VLQYWAKLLLLFLLFLIETSRTIICSSRQFIFITNGRNRHGKSNCEIVDTGNMQFASLANILVLPLNIPWVLVRKRTIPTEDRRWSAKLVPTFADSGAWRGQRGGSLQSLISVYRPKPLSFFFIVASHLSLLGWADPIPDPRLLRKPGSAGNRTRGL